MKISALIAIASFGFLASVGAHAASGEADPSQQLAMQIDGKRTVAEVRAEGEQVAATRSTEPNGSRVLGFAGKRDVTDVRAEAEKVAKNRSIEPAGSRVFSLN